MASSSSRIYVLENGAGPVIPDRLSVGAGERLDMTVVVLPGTMVRVPVTIDLTGPGAEVNLNGIYICSGNDEVSFDIRMNHLVEGCKSRQLFNGLAAGASKCAFFGKIEGNFSTALLQEPQNAPSSER